MSLKALAAKVLERNTEWNAGGTEPQNSGTRGGTRVGHLGGAPEAPRKDFSGKNWDAETTALIEWFNGTEPPSGPFELCRGVTVANPKRFWEALRRDLGAGPNGPRARYGALQQDLWRLAALKKRE